MSGPRFTVSRAEFASALSQCAKMAPTNSHIPVLSHLLIRAAASGSVTVSATDLDTEITVRLSGRVTRAGEVAVPAHRLARFVASIPDKDLLCETSDVFEVEGRLCRAHFAVIAAEDFPSLAVGGGVGETHAMEADALAAAVRTVAPAASTEKARYYLNGVYFDPVKGGIRLVATDGHRLIASMIAKPRAWDAKGSIMRRTAVPHVLRALDGCPDIARIGFSDAQWLIETPAATLRGKFVDGAYPDYAGRVLYPGKAAGTITADAKDLFSATRQLERLVGRRAPVEMSADEEALFLLAQGHGEQVTGIQAVLSDVAGSAEPFGVQIGYLLDALRGRRGSVKLAVIDPRSPIKVTFGDDQSTEVVIMPVRGEVSALPPKFEDAARVALAA